MQTGKNEKFEKLRHEAEIFYKSIGAMYCPYVHAEVHFSAEGFQHLLFKSWNRARTRQEQTTRLRLLPLVPKIIAASHTLQEYDQRQLFVRQKINSRWEKHLKVVTYFVFIAIVKKVRLKIVIKEIEGAAKQFYSLYPFWKMDNMSGKKIFYSGNLEND